MYIRLRVVDYDYIRTICILLHVSAALKIFTEIKPGQRLFHVSVEPVAHSKNFYAPCYR